jgi:uncharacterized protein (TIGR03083 family)
MARQVRQARQDGGAATATRALGHAEWMALATEEYRRLLELLGGLDDAAWSAPTDCAGWDVHAIVAHLAGAAASNASIRELRRQQRIGKRLRPDVDTVDAMNEVQVRERADHPPARLLAEFAELAPRAARARRRIPGPIRALPVTFGPPLGTKPLGYLFDRIYTRDAWLHRVDISRATGAELVLTADHDGRIVSDVADEWAALHGQPVDLVLTGPAGGRWRFGAGGDRLELDAVEFCRILSGRAAGTGLLTTRVNF